MPPRPTLSSSAKVEIAWTGPDAAQAVNIMYVLGSGDISSEPSLTAIANLFSTKLQGAGTWLNAISSTWKLSNIRVLDNSGETENVGVSTPNAAGSGGGTPLPPSAALCMSWPIPAHYRGGHPRTYVAGLMVTNMDTNGGKFWLATTISQWEGIGSALIAAIGTSSVLSPVVLTLGTISYFSGKVLREPPLFRVFEGCVVGSRLDSQRRRLGKEPALP